MSTIKLEETAREIGGVEYTILTVNGTQYIQLEDVLPFLTQPEGKVVKSTQEAYHTEKIVLNGKKFEAYVVNGERFLSVSDAAEYWGATASGISVRLGKIEADLKKELEKKRQQEINDHGTSAIDPEQDSKIRYRFGFHLRKRWLKVTDVEKYFFSRVS